MVKLTRYNSFQQLKASEHSIANKHSRKALEASELQKFIALVRKHTSFKKSAEPKASNG